MRNFYSKTVNRTIPLLIGVSIVCVFLVSYNKWKVLERKAYDIRFRLIERFGLGHDQITGKVVVVGIDEKTVIKEKPVLFLYSDIGQFIDKMKEYKVAVIGIDLIPVHRLGNKLTDAVLTMFGGGLDSKEEAFTKGIGDRLDKSLLGPILNVSRSIPIVQVFNGELVPYYYGAVAFMKNVYLSSGIFTDGDTGRNDGIIRKQETFNKEDFAFALYSLLAGQETLPNPIYLNYSLGKNIPIYCFTDVMNDKVSSDKFAGKAVILGYINGYEDIHLIPLKRLNLSGCFLKEFDNKRLIDTRLPGSLIHAILTETLLTQTSLKEIHFKFQVSILSFLVLAGLIVSTQLKPSKAIGLVFITMTLFFIVNLFFFSKGYVIHLFPQVLSPFFVLAFIYPYRYVVEEKNRQMIYKTFSYYMDNKVIDSMIGKDPSSLLKGEERDVCVLFMDIRNFSSLSQKHEAEKIVGFLNLYFGRITEIIQYHEGFVNKFIGDGLLAFFATGENVVENALQSAEKILLETQQLNQEGLFKPFIDDWEIQTGIGIHFGRVVMGNVGSEKKMDFTIIGDNVNIASRIEGLTKQLEKAVLLSNAAYGMVEDKSNLEFLGEFQVKGLDNPIAIYTRRIIY